jgi:hypothetical protein
MRGGSGATVWKPAVGLAAPFEVYRHHRERAHDVVAAEFGELFGVHSTTTTTSTVPLDVARPAVVMQGRSITAVISSCPVADIARHGHGGAPPSPRTPASRSPNRYRASHSTLPPKVHVGASRVPASDAMALATSPL